MRTNSASSLNRNRSPAPFSEMIMRTLLSRVLAGLVFLLWVVTPGLHADVVYTLDFTNQPDGNAVQWLKKNGFEFKSDADDLQFRFESGKLVIAADDDVSGIIIKEVNIENARRVRIQWGVDKYPEGANWDKDVLREAVGVIISFGDEKISSGAFYIPDIPYFIGFFLGENDTEGKAYIGNFYKKGGRYFCVPCNNPAGKTVITDFEIYKRFQTLYKKTSVPPVSAIAIETDVRDTDGVSKAFINKIEFLSE